jgi:hypothetical protein
MSSDGQVSKCNACTKGQVLAGGFKRLKMRDLMANVVPLWEYVRKLLPFFRGVLELFVWSAWYYTWVKRL